MNVPLPEFVARIGIMLPAYASETPWKIIDNLDQIIRTLISDCAEEYFVADGIAIHKSAVVEQHAVLKPPVYVGKNVTIGANAYLRSGVLLDQGVHIGAGCEIKQSIVFEGTAIAHFNYIGNSIIGSHVNFEAGSVAANHYNERENKLISVLYRGSVIDTGAVKFGSLVGDGCRIGANAVLSPGTILEKKTIVRRLELVEQLAADPR